MPHWQTPVATENRIRDGAEAAMGYAQEAGDVTDKVFRDMALSARDAALLASPIQIPGTRYEKTQTLTINLDPSANFATSAALSVGLGFIAWAILALARSFSGGTVAAAG